VLINSGSFLDTKKCEAFFFFLNGMIAATNGLGQETSKDNTNQLNEGNANPNTGKHTCLVFDLLGELRDASDCPQSFISVGTQDHV